MTVITEFGEASFPIGRANLFDPDPALAALPPISRVMLPAGETDWVEGWLVTGYAVARTLLADQRFSSVRTHVTMATRSLTQRFRSGGVGVGGRGFFMSADDPEHARYRGLLTGQFSAKRLRALQPRVAQIVDDCLEDLAAADRPADLVAHFALPVPSLVICELLGVDSDNRPCLQDLTRELLNFTNTPERSRSAGERLYRYLAELVTDKRATPDDAMLSGLIRDDPSLTDQELTNMAVGLLVAGHETTANMLGLGTFALLCHPDQLRALRANPDLMPRAVEELLRYLSVAGAVGMPRVARENLTLGGAQIKTGQTVLISLPQVNRDTALTTDPNRLDITRERSHHLAFGHGIHQCLGSQLARIEMQTGFRALLDRFGSLALAVAPEQVPMRTDMSIYGVHTLPVTW